MQNFTNFGLGADYQTLKFSSHQDRKKFYRELLPGLDGHSIEDIFIEVGYFLQYCNLLEVIVNSLYYDLYKETGRENPLGKTDFFLTKKGKSVSIHDKIRKIAAEKIKYSSCLDSKWNKIVQRLEEFNNQNGERIKRNIVAHRTLLMSFVGAYRSIQYADIDVISDQIFIKPSDEILGYEWLVETNERMAKLLYDLDYNQYLHRLAKNLNNLMTIPP
jgi:hypothetical protein